MEILTYILKLGLLAFLAAAAFADLHSRSLNLIMLCISFTAGFLLQTVLGQLSVWEILGGSALGGASAAVSFLSSQAIGYGDSFAIGVCGAWLGLFESIFLLLCAFLIMAVFGIVMLALKKAKPKDSLPFMPFLLAGYIAVLAF